MKTIINVLITISMIAVAVSFYMVIWRTGMTLLGYKDKIFQKINEDDYTTGAMTGKKRTLSKLGIMYRVKNYDLLPSYYLVLRISIGLLTAVLLFLLPFQGKDLPESLPHPPAALLHSISSACKHSFPPHWQIHGSPCCH